MPFVFVHGVANRKDDDYVREERIRAAFLKEYVAPVVGINPAHEVYAPYWGGDGVRFWRDLSVIPKGREVETFGADADAWPPSLGIAVNEGNFKSGDSLNVLARSRPEVVIDLIFDFAMAEERSDDQAAELAKAYNAAQTRLKQHGSDWLAVCTSEAELLDAVYGAVEPVPVPGGNGVERFGGTGLWNMLEEAGSRWKLLAGRQLSHAVVGIGRQPLTRKVATFIGDAFQYLAERGDGSHPGPIAATVLKELERASAKARETEEPLIVISHSFGGEIVYDILTHYAKDSDIEVDAWVTVGSQVGLFEEMSLLWTSPGRTDRGAVPTEAITSPQRAKRWINIVDTNDVLGFLVLPTFTASTPETVRDFKYDTGHGVAGAHSGYFRWPSFYKRLASRIGEK